MWCVTTVFAAYQQITRCGVGGKAFCLVVLFPQQLHDFGDEDVGIVDRFFEVGVGSGSGEKPLAVAFHGVGRESG